MNAQPEALYLADNADKTGAHRVAAELRRLYALNAELLEAVKRLADWAEEIRASGDAGYWDWSEGDEYMQACAAIAKAEKTLL